MRAGLGSPQHVGKLMSDVPELPFKIHPDVPLYATENFYHFNEVREAPVFVRGGMRGQRGPSQTW